MQINDLKAFEGAKRPNKRRGQGQGTGNGKTAGKGNKGQKARSGGGVRIGFEGGQTPIYRRLPRRGFNNANFAINYDVVNVEDFAKFPAGSTVTRTELVAVGLLNRNSQRFKVLANGELKVAVKVVADKWSPAAEEKIKAAGGSISAPQKEETK